MNAIIRSKAGKEFSTMKVQSIDNPILQPGHLRIKMISSRINPVDMDLMKGFPTLKYKDPQIGGIDGAGTVLEVGKGVRGFAEKDQVFFYRLFSDIGTWAEEITIPFIHCAKVPAGIQVQEAGAIALPLLTAFEALAQFDAQKGEKVLIHGVGGGVGFQALVLAKLLGFFVIGTGSLTDKTELEKAGLDRLIDYKTQEFSKLIKAREVDYIFDTQGGEMLLKSISLRPKKVVSLKYVDPTQMHKAGVSLPWVLNWLMRLMMGKYNRHARKNKVELVGQVTGANGIMLQKAAELIAPAFHSRTFRTITLGEISTKGLTRNDIGKVILF